MHNYSASYSLPILVVEENFLGGDRQLLRNFRFGPGSRPRQVSGFAFNGTEGRRIESGLTPWDGPDELAFRRWPVEVDKKLILSDGRHSCDRHRAW